MTIRGNQLALAVTAAALALAGIAPATALAAPAAATVTAAARHAAPGISPSSCRTAWLRLWGSRGESCYRGRGTLAVNLPGVRRGQVTGRHVACLTAVSPHERLCVAGPATFSLGKPVRVVAITLFTGQAR